jgi:hypothetical protein
MKRCIKLREMPSVVPDWQQTTWCPDCEHYDRGTCANQTRVDSNAPCPFDGKALPVREVPVDSNDDQPEPALDGSGTAPQSLPHSAALEQAIKCQIMKRTGGRIQMLEVEVIGDRVVLRGCSPSYYLKQLVLQGVLDVLGSAGAMRLEVNVAVAGGPS